VVVDIPTTPVPAGSTGRPASVRLSAYVELPLDEVLARFTEAHLSDLLTSASAHALGDHVTARLDASEPRWESAHHVVVPFGWTVTGRSGRSASGTARLSLLVVRSGRDAVTELLVDLPVTDTTRRAVSAAARHALDEVTAQIESTR